MTNALPPPEDSAGPRHAEPFLQSEQGLAWTLRGLSQNTVEPLLTIAFPPQIKFLAFSALPQRPHAIT